MPPTPRWPPCRPAGPVSPLSQAPQRLAGPKAGLTATPLNGYSRNGEGSCRRRPDGSSAPAIDHIGALDVSLSGPGRGASVLPPVRRQDRRVSGSRLPAHRAGCLAALLSFVLLLLPVF